MIICFDKQDFKVIIVEGRARAQVISTMFASSSYVHRANKNLRFAFRKLKSGYIVLNIQNLIFYLKHNTNENMVNRYTNI
jgi:hypothetical protein